MQCGSRRFSQLQKLGHYMSSLSWKVKQTNGMCLPNSCVWVYCRFYFLRLYNLICFQLVSMVWPICMSPVRLEANIQPVSMRTVTRNNRSYWRTCNALQCHREKGKPCENEKRRKCPSFSMIYHTLTLFLCLGWRLCYFSSCGKKKNPSTIVKFSVVQSPRVSCTISGERRIGLQQIFVKPLHFKYRLKKIFVVFNQWHHLRHVAPATCCWTGSTISDYSTVQVSHVMVV